MDKVQLHRFCELGFSTYRIAKETNKSQTTVRHWMRKFGLKTKLAIGGFCCKYCGETQRGKMSGKGGGAISHTLCKRCHSVHTIDAFRQKKQLAVDYKGGKCQRCGYHKSLRSLQFHHRDPDKKDIKFSSNWLKRASCERMKKELDKCDLLCGNCHGEVHDEIEAKKIGSLV